MQASDSLDGFNSIAASFILTRCNWEGQGVDSDVHQTHTPVRGQILNQALGKGKLCVGCSSLTLFVNG